MAQADLPHNISTPRDLYDQCTALATEFHGKLRSTRVAPRIKWTTHQRRYGARLDLIIYSPEYCHCTDPECKDGRYALFQHFIRIKRDCDIRFLQTFLNDQINMWPRIDRGDDSDPDSVPLISRHDATAQL